MSRLMARKDLGKVVHTNFVRIWKKTDPEPSGNWQRNSTFTSLSPFFKAATVHSDFVRSTEYAVAKFVPGIGINTYRTSSGANYIRWREVQQTGWDSRARLGQHVHKTSATLVCPALQLEEAEQKIAVAIRQVHGSLAASLAESLETAGYLANRSNLLARVVNLAGRRKWRQLWRTILREYGEESQQRTNILGNYSKQRARGGKKSYTQVKADMEAAAKKRFADPHGKAAAAGGWLETQYAIKPLISDVETLAKIFNGEMSKDSSRVVVIKGKCQVIEESGAPAGALDTKFWAEIKSSFKATYRVDEADLAFFTLTGLSDIPGAIWEKLKLSFVVDWMLPIGDWLTTLTPTLGLTFLDAYVSTKFVEIHQNRTGQSRNWIPPGIATGFCRTRANPRAHFNVRNPFSSIERVASTIALIRQNKKFTSL